METDANDSNFKGFGMDRLEEFWPRTDSEQIRLRSVCQAEEFPYQGLSQVNGNSSFEKHPSLVSPV